MGWPQGHLHDGLAIFLPERCVHAKRVGRPGHDRVLEQVRGLLSFACRLGHGEGADPAKGMGPGAGLFHLGQQAFGRAGDRLQLLDVDVVGDDGVPQGSQRSRCIDARCEILLALGRHPS